MTLIRVRGLALAGVLAVATAAAAADIATLYSDPPVVGELPEGLRWRRGHDTLIWTDAQGRLLEEPAEGGFELMLFPGLGHGLRADKARSAVFDRIAGFLLPHLGVEP